MMTIESIKSEIIKLNNEVHKISDEYVKLCRRRRSIKNPSAEYSRMCDECDELLFKGFEIEDRISDLGEEVFKRGYGFKFEWVQDGCRYSSKWIKLRGKSILRGDTLLYDYMKVDIANKGLYIVFSYAYGSKIELEWDIVKH